MDFEILAPAGSMENFNTAINCGANAVYLGLTEFNARIKANNFNLENISEVINKAHLLNTKVYITINTLIKNDEMPRLLYMVTRLIEAKADAFIVQDLGVAYALSKTFNNIVMHASTQMGIHNLAGAKVLERLGFKRVILSRETTVTDIKEIANNTNLEIEYFVHGANCVCFSGNCYFSSLKYQNSGNRGRCQQLCRMEYSSQIDGKTTDKGYLLSPSDRCLINNLKSLIDAGVTSFKIEGRLKRAGYVGQTVLSYRRALNNILNLGSDSFSAEDEINKLKVCFSRGEFNEESYLFDIKNKSINKLYNNHMGIKIGKVVSVNAFKDLYQVVVNCKDINIGDGLKFMDGNNQIASMGVGNFEKLKNGSYILFTKSKIKQGADVYKILDGKLEESILNLKKTLLINVKVYAKIGNQLAVELQYANNTICVKSEYICPVAKKVNSVLENIKSQFIKTNDDIIKVENIEIDADNVFIPKSVINELRRISIQEIKTEIINNYNNKLVNITKNNELDDTVLLTSKFNYICINEITPLDIIPKNSAYMLVISPIQFTESVVDSMINEIKLKFKDVKIAINLPIIANYLDYNRIEKIVLKYNNIYIVANNLYAFDLIKINSKIIAGLGLNIMNNFAIKLVTSLGAIDVINSIECNRNNMADNSVVYALGYFPIMTICHCPIKVLFNNDCKNCKFKEDFCIVDDNKKCSYKLRRIINSKCYFELLNNNLINLLGRTDYRKFIDLRELNKEQIRLAISNINNRIKITEKDTMGLFLSELN